MPDSSVPPAVNPLVIAICGGGIAGLSAAITLQRLPNVQIHVFEQATAFREVRILNHTTIAFLNPSVLACSSSCHDLTIYHIGWSLHRIRA